MVGGVDIRHEIQLPMMHIKAVDAEWRRSPINRHAAQLKLIRAGMLRWQ